MAHDVTNEETVRAMFDAYLAGDADTAVELLADTFRFTSPQDDSIDKQAFMERCFPTAEGKLHETHVDRPPVRLRPGRRRRVVGDEQRSGVDALRHVAGRA